MQTKEIAVIDVGSSKITVAVGERGVNKTFLIKARKDYLYDGFQDGEFFDAESVKKILFSAAEFIKKTIKKRGITVYVGVPGDFTRVSVKESQISFSGKKKIAEEDVDKLFDSAFVPTSAKYSLINRSAIVYELDDYRRLANPIGAVSEILKGKLSFILCSNYFFDLFRKTLKAAGIDKVECVSVALAEVMSLIDPEERDRIVMFLDIGYITTTLSLVQGDGILYQKSFSFGGGFITAALTQKFDTDFDIAEELKRKVNLSAVNVGATETVECSDGSVYNAEESREAIITALDSLCEDIENSVENCGYVIPEYVSYLITGGGISGLRGAKEHVSGRIGAAVSVVVPKVPLMDKPTESSLISLLDMAFSG